MVFPLLKEESSQYHRCFVPCSGPDPENDELPTHVRPIGISSICNVNIDNFTTKKSTSRTSKISAGENWFTLKKQDVREGDIIMLHSEQVIVKAVAPDFRSDEFITIRTKSNIKRNHRPADFKILREPAIMGSIVDLKHIMFDNYIDITHQKKNTENVGKVNIKFRVANFNAMGFMTYDTSIPI